MRVSFLLVLALTLALAVAANATVNRHTRSPVAPSPPSSSSRVSIYTRTEPPPGWSLGDEAPLASPITFTIIVQGSNADALEERFWQVSDPDHPLYGHFMTNAEIEQMVAPSPSDLAAFYSTLSQHGIYRPNIVSHGDSFDITTTVAHASSLFSSTFYNFHHAESGMSTIKQWGEFSLPSTLAHQVRLILNIHTFPTIEQRLRINDIQHQRQAQLTARLMDDAAPAVPAWVPKAIASIYGVPYPIKPLSTPEVNAAVVEWSDQTFSPADLANFSIDVAVPLSPVDKHRIIGNNSEVPYPGVEASLDIQWIEGLNPGFTPWFWLVSDPNMWMYNFTTAFLVATDYPSVLSLSYGLPETMQCSYFPKGDCYGLDWREYIKVVDKQFMKIGLIGVSTIVCSQDRGTYLSSPNAPPQVFMPEYPGTSPYITSVGATEYGSPEFNLTNPPPACDSSHNWQCVSGGTNEQAVSYANSYYLSGGGFSSVDYTPAYQSDAVNAYFNSGVTLPDPSVWNRTGRGFPDVSAIGMNGYIVDAGRPGLVSGTSMSTPIVAAIVALLQSDYMKLTNSTLGFLNPMLYKAQASGAGLFKDIVLGDNCRTTKCVGVQDGFSTAKGWDPVTGLGTPQYPNMKAYIQKLGQKVNERRQVGQ